MANKKCDIEKAMSRPSAARFFRPLTFSYAALCAALCAFTTMSALAAVPVAAPDSASDVNTQAVELYNAGQYSAAVAAFERAYSVTPDNATIRRNLCNAHQAVANELAGSADFTAAAKHLEAAMAVDPENESPLVQLGSYYLRMNMVNEAMTRLEAAITVNPKNVDAHELLGEAYYLDNDIPSARVQWEWVLEVRPHHRSLRERIEKAVREENAEAGFRPTGSRHFQLSVTPEVPSDVLRRVLSILERAYSDIGRNFGRVYPTDRVQVIAYDAESFADATQLGGHVGGLYDGKIRIPLTDSTGTLLNETELRQRLFHEYTHLVARQVCGNRMPWWLNEGLAETFSHNVEPAEIALLEKAYEQELLFHLAELEGNQLDKLGPDALRMAYSQAHATVNLLWTRSGQIRLTQMMASLAEGVAPETALHRHYNRTYRSLEKEVAKSLASGH